MNEDKNWKRSEADNFKQPISCMKKKNGIYIFY